MVPFRRRLTATTGRPTIAIETYLRLMYLKHRYDLGYETLCKEVSDSFTWRRFCRIAIDGRVPDPSTLMKLTRRLGPELVDELNAELLAVAVERRVLRSRRLRVDSTLVEADIRSPTDSGLCAHAVSRLTRLAKRVQAAGLGAGVRLRDRGRSVGKRVRAISGARSRGRDARPTIDRLTGEIAARAKQTAREVRAVISAAKPALAAGSRAGGALVRALERELAAAQQILDQTDLRLAGQTTIPNRRVSLVDPDARPIRRGTPGRATEFGYRATIADTPEGFVISNLLVLGNPADDGQLAGALTKAKQAGIRVTSVYADRGYGTKIGDAALDEHAITHRTIPRRGNAAPVQATRTWKRRYRFRNGLEGRISQLKRKGLRRTRLRGLNGAQTWVGAITLAHNLKLIATLT